MEEMNKKIEGIRRLLADMKCEKYAVVNPEMAALDDYTKDLYLKMLCTVIEYENVPSEAQLLYLKRLMIGVSADGAPEDYMRRALMLTDTDVRDFLERMRETNAGYYFALETILLATMGNQAPAACEYPAELIELIGITERELAPLCLTAKSVILQDSALFDRAKADMNRMLQELQYTPYIQTYYAGALTDTATELYYTSPDNNVSYEIEFPALYEHKQVTFDRLELTIDKNWVFNECQSVVFKNCRLRGSGGTLVIDSAELVRFEDCVFREFDNCVAELSNVKKLVSDRCEYINCGYCYTSDGRGGVLRGLGFWQGTTIILTGNTLTDCYVSRKEQPSYCGVSGVFFGTDCSAAVSHITVEGNTFQNCRCINNGRYVPAIIGNLYADEKEVCDNACTGGVKRIMEYE